MTSRERGEPICVGDALRLTRDLDGDSWIVERAFRPEATTLLHSKAAFDESFPRLVYDLDWRGAEKAVREGKTVERQARGRRGWYTERFDKWPEGMESSDRFRVVGPEELAKGAPKPVYDLTFMMAVHAMKAGATVESAETVVLAPDHHYRFKMRRDGKMVGVFQGMECVLELHESDFDARYRVVLEGE